MQIKSIWKPIEFNPEWNNVNTEKFDNIYPSWERKRAELISEPEQYERFFDRLKRKQAIDTGIIEHMYDLKRGITETFIKEGFVDSYLHHGDTNISHNLLMYYLKDNFSAIDFVFDFVKHNRTLSVSYIKELHHLITLHQETTDAVDSMGNRVKIKLLKGEFKRDPNNPERNGVVYSYCPPEQVESEMDNLVDIFNSELKNSHVLLKAAFLHHAFVQIHPFQDGNGRIARLLAGFVLIREGLFPFSVDRDDRNKYISALESAYNGEFQPLTDIIAENQIASIGLSLNWQMVTDTSAYDKVLQTFEKKLRYYKIAEAQQRNKRIYDNMTSVFSAMRKQMEYYRTDLTAKLNGQTAVNEYFCAPDGAEAHFFAKQIVSYANLHDYYVNLSLNKCWGSVIINIGDKKAYRMVVSLHHYGYDDSAFAIGAFWANSIFNMSKNKNEFIDEPMGIPPLITSSEKDISSLLPSINRQIEAFVTATLAYIANELT